MKLKGAYSLEGKEYANLDGIFKSRNITLPIKVCLVKAMVFPVFIEKYNFPNHDQEEIENLNRPITSTEIETVIKNLPANKSPLCVCLVTLTMSLLGPYGL